MTEQQPPSEQPPSEQPGYPDPGHPQPGYPQPGYPQPGYPQPGYPQPGYPQYPQYQQPGYPQYPQYQQPGYPQYQQYQQPKKRPSPLWFIPGGVALVVAIGCLVVAIVTGVRMFHTDGYLLADGQAHSFALGDGEHMLFAQDGVDAPTSCSATDGSGQLAVDELDLSGTQTITADGYDWYPFAKFSSDGSPVSITCAGNAQVRIGAPAGDTQFVVLGVTVIGAIGFGALGLAGLVLVTVLYVSRRPRKGFSA